MIPTTESLIADLYFELSDSEAPLPIVVTEQVISGLVVGVNETLDFSYTFKHPDVDIEIGFMYPTRWEALDLDPEGFAALDYREQAKLVAKQAVAQGFEIRAGDERWLEMRNRSGETTKSNSPCIPARRCLC